jgi:hypothetical protein
MDRFIIREPQVSSPNNDTVGQGTAQDIENADDPNPNDDQPEIELLSKFLTTSMALTLMSTWIVLMLQMLMMFLFSQIFLIQGIGIP